MNLAWGAVVVVVAVVATVTAMLLVRRRAPEGSWFADGDRASGVFGVLATGFSVLLGFIIFLAFESYDESRTGAETEAIIVTQQVQTAQFLPVEVRADLTGELVCYGRSVISSEWPALEAGEIGDSFNPWSPALFETIRAADPKTAVEQSAYDRWMDQTAQREQARNARAHGAEGIIPVPLWLVLITICVVIFGYMLFFADRAEGAGTQAMLMGSVTVVIALLMALLVFLDRPHGDGIGKLQPTAFERTLRQVDAELDVIGMGLQLPCDAVGRALTRQLLTPAEFPERKEEPLKSLRFQGFSCVGDTGFEPEM